MKLTEENLIKLDELLDEAYGQRIWEPKGTALDNLLLTVLTQATNDRNSHKAFQALKKAFPTWEEVIEAPLGRVVDLLRECGLAHQKALRMKGILRGLKDERGELSLDFLGEMNPEDAFNYLMRFKGVGPKTAACTLLFTWGMDVFPVDTHIHRISKRLGLVDGRASAIQTQERWQVVLPPGRAYSLHVGLIEHGRKVCVARNPVCYECRLTGVCDYFSYHIGG